MIEINHTRQKVWLLVPRHTPATFPKLFNSTLKSSNATLNVTESYVSVRADKALRISSQSTSLRISLHRKTRASILRSARASPTASGSVLHACMLLANENCAETRNCRREGKCPGGQNGGEKYCGSHSLWILRRESGDLQGGHAFSF